ncbi:MAG: hypothetical protein ACI93T_000654, partial [Porticoccaceae bacterium]
RRAEHPGSSLAGSLASTLPQFLKAQRIVERRDELDRELLLGHARHRASQLVQLGQNPWLDAAQD